MRDHGETTMACIGFATKNLRTGSSAPKMRATVHRTSVSHVAIAFTCKKISWPIPDDEVNRKFVVVVIDVSQQRVTSTSSKWRERPPTFPFRVVGNFNVTPSFAKG